MTLNSTQLIFAQSYAKLYNEEGESAFLMAAATVSSSVMSFSAVL